MTKITHTVTTDALATIGTKIDATAGRDAIHLAVEPAVAGFELVPGQHISIRDGLAGPWVPFFGIVDPFLTENVKKGDRFWLVVYPRTITSLRHVWEHPNFTTPTAKVDAPVDTDKEKSIKWMTDWAVRNMGIDYYGDDQFRSAGDAYQSAMNAGFYNHIGPYESARDHIDAEWWDHWEAITGEKGKRDEYFSCSC